MKRMNPFVIATTVLYVLSAFWYLKKGGSNAVPLAGMFFGYAAANFFILNIK